MTRPPKAPLPINRSWKRTHARNVLAQVERYGRRKYHLRRQTHNIRIAFIQLQWTTNGDWKDWSGVAGQANAILSSSGRESWRWRRPTTTNDACLYYYYFQTISSWSTISFLTTKEASQPIPLLFQFFTMDYHTGCVMLEKYQRRCGASKKRCTSFWGFGRASSWVWPTGIVLLHL